MPYTLATEKNIISVEAGAALEQGQGVKFSGSTVVASTGSDIPVGIVLEEVASGDEASVYVPGEPVFVAAQDAAITLGQELVAAAAGRFDGAGATGTFVGRALEASDAQDHLIKAILYPVPRVVA